MKYLFIIEIKVKLQIEFCERLCVFGVNNKQNDI